MYSRITYVVILVLLIFHDVIDGKKARRKRPKAEEENSVAQPNVLTYSNFGFNDVGSYDGFVPSSPDYATFLSTHGGKEESTTRLYAPAFPTALESTGFSGGYGSHITENQSYNTGPDGQEHGFFHLEPNSMNTFGFTNLNVHDENKFSSPDQNSGVHSDMYNMPVYGSKINLKSKSKPYDEFNDTGHTSFNGETTTLTPTYKNNEKIHKTKRGRPLSESKQTFSESNQLNTVNYIPSYPTASVEPFPKMSSFNFSSSLLNFPRVVDFTNLKQFHQSDLGEKYPKSNKISKPSSNTNPIGTTGSDFIHTHNYNKHGDTFFKLSPGIKSNLEIKDQDRIKQESEIHENSNDDDFFKHSSNRFKDTISDNEFKDKVKGRPWKNNPNKIPFHNGASVMNTEYGNDNDEYKQSKNSMNGYEYSTNHSSTSFKYDVVEPKRPFNNNKDEIIPASSNLDLSDYQFPSKDFTNYNKVSKLKSTEEDPDYSAYTQSQYKHSEDYLNKFKNLYTTTPSTTTNWGNIFKSSEFSSHKSHKKRPLYAEENNNDETVYIPKRPLPSSSKYGNYENKSNEKPNDWSLYNSYYRPYISNKPQYDWNKEITSTRFKSEEDLLGLRTHDTLHPSYLPFVSSTSEVSEDFGYKQLTDKWRTDYLKSKHKDVYHDYESYASNSKPIHVPVPKPYPIEVPHPVIIPVPQPYPVRVPVPRPVAVPVVQELMVPIEKPVPYPVIKNVPYPIEKPVPVPVEKQVPVPVMKPYPVPVPQIRPVFHHSKYRDEFNNLDHDGDVDWFKPESSKRVPYVKRPKSSRNRQRRPSRMTYPDRSRRRSPQHQLDSKDRRHSSHSKRHSYPSSMEYSYPRYRHRDTEFDAYENDNSDYLSYCKSTGNC